MTQTRLAVTQGTNTLASYAKKRKPSKWGTIDRCQQCNVKLLEDELGVTRWLAMGPLTFCSKVCVEAFKEGVRNGTNNTPL